ncbi:MAG: MerR family transcriptional regulator [Blautia sp.]|nr:MerR family transcriptional regulator [Blautia sp.]MDY5031372.1 MerR family transcriptional regulator [Blautia sp.]
MKEIRMYQQHPPFEVKEDSHFYKIGTFANMNRVTIKTLRYYDEQKLLMPVYVDAENGYRYYEASQAADLHRIIALKKMGFSIEDIRRMINGAAERSLLLGKKSEILKEIAVLTDRLAEVESYLAKDNIDLSAPVLIKKIPEVTVCSMQQRIESYDNLFSLMPEMGAEMERLGCICAEPAYCFIRYLEPGYSDEDILVEACEAVTEKKRVPIRWHSRCFRKFPRLPVYITEALTTPFIDPTFRY